MVVGERKKNHHDEKARPARPRRYLPWVILAIGVPLSIAAYFSVKDWEKAVTRTDFEILSASHSAAVYNELARHLDASEALLGLYDVSPQVDRRQFAQFTATLIAKHNDIQALMWAPRVSTTQRTALVQQAAQNGFMNFHIRDVNGNVAPVAATSPTDYFPIYYVQPEKQNDDLLGVDLMADPNYHAMLETARDTGQMAVSPPVQLNLKLESRMGNGVLLAQAVYQRDANLETVAGRRAGLEGYMLQLFRIGDLIEEALKESAVLGLDISVVYGKNPGDLQRNYFHSSASRTDHIIDSLSRDSTSGLQLRTPLEGLGKSWGLMFTPAPRFWSNHQMWTSWAVLATGLLLTLLLATFASMLSRRPNQP